MSHPKRLVAIVTRSAEPSVVLQGGEMGGWWKKALLEWQSQSTTHPFSFGALLWKQSESQLKLNSRDEVNSSINGKWNQKTRCDINYHRRCSSKTRSPPPLFFLCGHRFRARARLMCLTNMKWETIDKRMDAWMDVFFHPTGPLA